MSESVLRGTPPSATDLRDLVTAWLPQGFARLVQPIASTTITTDTGGLIAGEVKIQTWRRCPAAWNAHVLRFRIKSNKLLLNYLSTTGNFQNQPAAQLRCHCR